MDDLLDLTPGEFEDAVAEYLRAQGFVDVQRVGGAGDLGVDIHCKDKHGRVVVVQCKRYQRAAKVTGPDIQHFFGMVVHAAASRGIFVTTSDFTTQARNLAAQRDLELIDGYELGNYHQGLLRKKEPDRLRREAARREQEKSKNLSPLSGGAVVRRRGDSRYWHMIEPFAHLRVMGEQGLQRIRDGDRYLPEVAHEEDSLRPVQPESALELPSDVDPQNMHEEERSPAVVAAAADTSEWHTDQPAECDIIPPPHASWGSPMSQTVGGVDLGREKSVRLFTYLKELSGLRTKTIRTIDQYDQVVWADAIPHEPGCSCAAWFGEGGEEREDVWFEIRKPQQRIPPPPVPRLLDPWLDPTHVTDSSREMPELRQRIPAPLPERPTDFEAPSEPVYDRLEDHPELHELWEAYVQDQWWPWADKDRRLKAIQEVYTDLFSIYQKQQRLGEQYEVVLGLGLVSWRTPSGQRVHRHLVTAQTNLVFDAVRGTMVLEPAAEGPKLALEQDMLEAQERPDTNEERACRDQLGLLGDDVWNKPGLDSLFRAWVHAVSPRGHYSDALQPPTEAHDDPMVTLAPALILRRRTERSLVKVFDEIIEQLQQGGDVPLGVRRLVEVVDDVVEEEQPTPLDGRQGVATDVYFPLPANEEQLEIVQRLKTRQGVLVQGPPGTGKSHTIANLVCHLLATGQRVLVASHTPRALRVLREKVPAEISSLCVSLLGNDRAALEDLENAVHGITDRYDQWDGRQQRLRIDQLEGEIDALRRTEAQLRAELRSLRESETYSHVLGFGGYEGTTASIAMRLGQESPAFAWFADRPDPKSDPPLTAADAGELLSLLRELSTERAHAARQACIPGNRLPDPAEFAQCLAAEASAKARLDGTNEARAHPGYPGLVRAGRDQRASLLAGIQDLRSSAASLGRRLQTWAHQAANQVLTGQERVWRELSQTTIEQLANIGDRARSSEARRVGGLEGRTRTVVKAHAAALLAHLETGGSKGFAVFRPKVVKVGWYLVTDVTIDGWTCDRPEPLRLLLEWIDVSDRLDILRQYWDPHEPAAPGPFSAQVARYHDARDLLQEVLELGDKVNALRGILASFADVPEPPWHVDQELTALLAAIEAANADDELRQVEASRRGLAQQLRPFTDLPGAHPVCARLLAAVEDGNTDLYRAGYLEVSRLESDRSKLERRDVLLDGLRDAGPRLAAAVEASASDSDWDGRLEGIDAAWNWARATRWLEQRNDPQATERLLREITSTQVRIRAALRDLAAAKAWDHFFRRMTEPQRQDLMAWTLAMRRLGKGTGKYAAEHRRAARLHMEGCRSAIPAWIMPIYRVAETVRPGRDAFDVVIVDEASQSGPEALFLQYVAKKVVVVGDDKQISPEFIGIDREEANLIRRRHIADLPHHDALGFDNSFFEQASVRYGGRIRLREHFRCMPEIIQFSNNLCYQTEPLIPLRQYGADRLDPVRVTYVPDGYRRGSGSGVENLPEAQTVVDQIVRCCADPAYQEKSMGVISLQGDGQARLIWQLLVDELGPEEMEKRRLVCGDAYDFQGDERDVMFLSLVAAPDQRIGTLTSSRDQRRFNVAASRARDQMWLFHTATLRDLNPNCLRYRLLDYCLNPKVEALSYDGVSPMTDDLVPPFESLFEQRVFCKIRERGFRVVPQVPVAGYRIDLVVEGLRGRLAVECDGDTWHGPEQYDADMARQRQLERCGWTFWRVRGSDFFRDPERALAGLWTTLDRLGIVSSSREVTVPSAQSEQVTVATGLVEAVAIAPRPAPRAANGSPNDGNGGADDRSAEDPFGGAPLAGNRAWVAHPLPGLHEAALDEVLDGLIEIVSAEGPMLCRRAFRLYARAAGLEGVNRQNREVLNRAIFRGIQHRRIVERDEWGTQGQGDKVVRVPESPAVIVRERGDRTLDEIPPSEIAAAMRAMAEASGRSVDEAAETLFAEVLTRYDLERIEDSEWQSRIFEQVMTQLFTE